MALKALEHSHFLGASSQTLESPPLITSVSMGMFSHCRSMFSLELPHNATEINKDAFYYCICLRNVAFPPDAVFDDDIFGEQSFFDDVTDLQQLFSKSNARIVRELQHRFDDLRIHKLVYYQSYNQRVLKNLMDTTKLDRTGNQQDCLGMTPLHILACSYVHDLEVYHVIIDNYPTNLITEDRWGAVPLLCAFWGAAPREIIQFLLMSHESLYPDHEINWTKMVETIGRWDTPKKSIENLLQVKQMIRPDQPTDWDHLLDEFASPSRVSYESIFTERMRFLVM
jgi:hypothetical protein